MRDLIEARQALAAQLARLFGAGEAPALLGRIERLIDAKIAVRNSPKPSDKV